MKIRKKKKVKRWKFCKVQQNYKMKARMLKKNMMSSLETLKEKLKWSYTQMKQNN